MNAQVVEVGGKMLEAPGDLLPTWNIMQLLSPENHFWETLFIKMLGMFEEIPFLPRKHSSGSFSLYHNSTFMK